MSTSVQNSIDNPQDPNVKANFAKNDQGKIMSSLSSIATKYKRLGQEFCIPEHSIKEIEANNREKQWECLNDVVGEWLKWNFTDDVKGKVQPNADWLVRAVTEIDDNLAKNLKAEYWVNDKTNDTTHHAGAMGGKQEEKRAKQENEGIEEPDSGPPDVKEYHPELANKFKIEQYTDDLVKDINIVLVTATDVEFSAVMGQATPINGGKYTQTRSEGITFYIAMYGHYKVAIIRTGQGTKVTSEKLQKIQKVVKARYVIAIGICYGMEEGKKNTKFGSILVSKRMKEISFARQMDGGNSELNTTDYHSGETLYDIFENHHGFALDDGIDYGVNVLTGEDILVTESSLNMNQQHKDEIERQVPLALGGEMEAAAILGKPEEFEGIVIKAIADWGDKDKASCAPWKKFSSYAAAKYVWYQLSNIPEDELKRKP